MKLPARACRPLRRGFGESAYPPQEHDVIKQVKHLWCRLQQAHHHRRLDRAHPHTKRGSRAQKSVSTTQQPATWLQKPVQTGGMLAQRSTGLSCPHVGACGCAAHLQQCDVVPYAAHNQVGRAGVKACADLIHKQCLGGTDHQLQGTQSKHTCQRPP